MRAVNHTRPFSSKIGLWMVVWPSQIGSSPQYGDRPRVSAELEGVAGSRYGCLICVAVLVTGFSTGTMSVLSSGDPYTRPLALTRGLRLSVEMASCRYALGVDHSHMVN